MSVGGVFLWPALLYAFWIGLGWRKVAGERAALLRNTLLILLFPVLLTLYTLQESRLWAHLTFPPSFIGWALVVLGGLVMGLVQSFRRR